MRHDVIACSLLLTLSLPMPSAAQEPTKGQSKPGLARVGTATQALAVDLWARVAAAEGNVSYSPASIALAVAMTTAGARGETQKELLRFLHADAADLPRFAELARLVEGSAKGTNQVTITNRLFGAKSQELERPFLDLLDREFRAPLETLDIATDPEKARKHVNAWVDKNTNGRIQDLLPQGGVKAETKLLLANAIWLLADWASPFQKELTQPQPFALRDGKKKDVPMMYTSGHLECADVDGSVAVQLRYAGGELAMLFVLPPKDAEPSTWLSAKLLAKTSDLPGAEVRLFLPRFRVEAEKTLCLAKEMQALGVTSAFDRGRADFTGIANPKDPAERLFVEEVFHKAFVRVDEKGTEAAAATIVSMAPTSAAQPPAEPREVRFDRPFAFVLRHLPSGAVLFAGKVVDPR
jgi:serpin B